MLIVDHLSFLKEIIARRNTYSMHSGYALKARQSCKRLNGRMTGESFLFLHRR